MGVYNNSQPVRQSHGGTLATLIIGTLIGIGSLAVASLFLLIVYGYSTLHTPLDTASMAFFYGILALLVGVAASLPAMWVFFFVKRYKAARYTSFVPMVFVLVMMVSWQVLGALTIATSRY